VYGVRRGQRAPVTTRSAAWYVSSACLRGAFLLHYQPHWDAGTKAAAVPRTSPVLVTRVGMRTGVLRRDVATIRRSPMVFVGTVKLAFLPPCSPTGRPLRRTRDATGVGKRILCALAAGEHLFRSVAGDIIIRRLGTSQRTPATLSHMRTSSVHAPSPHVPVVHGAVSSLSATKPPVALLTPPHARHAPAHIPHLHTGAAVRSVVSHRQTQACTTPWGCDMAL